MARQPIHPPDTTPRQLKLGILPLLLMAASFIAIADWVVARDLYYQMRAMYFPTTPGQIDDAKLGLSHSMDVTTSFEIQYTYGIDGQRYTGNRYRYIVLPEDTRLLKRVIEHLRQSKTVPVYVNPNDPHDAIIQPGISGTDLMLIMFLLPAHVFAGLWVAAVITNDILGRSFAHVCKVLGIVGIAIPYLFVVVISEITDSDPPIIVPALTLIILIVLIGCAIAYVLGRKRSKDRLERKAIV
jgi:hypothetical protein